jgi:hypothetical protein
MAESPRLFTTREMLETISSGSKAQKFLRDTFMKKTITTDATTLEFDKTVQVNTIAKYTARGGDANVVNKQGFTNHIHTPPYVIEEIPFTVGDILDTVLPGENSYGSPAAPKVAVKTAGWLSDLNNRFDNLEEMQTATALQTGVITVQNTALGVDYEIDYGMPAGNKETLSASAVWGTAAVLPTLKAWAKVLRDQGHIVKNIVLEDDAYDLFVKDTQILSLLENRRVMIGEINPLYYADMNASYVGRLNVPGLNADIWVSSGTYESSAGVFTKFMTQYRCLLMGDVQLERVYSRIDNANTGSFVGERFPMQYWKQNGRSGLVSLESSPCMVLKNANAIFSAIVKS